MSDHVTAGVWVRVSTADQSEGSQVPDVERRCEERGYTVARRYELNDKSASKGEQDAKLREMLTDMRDGHISVLVCWHSDRVERRGPEALFKLLREIRDAGGRIESVKEPLLGTEDLSGEAVTALGAVISHQYSVHLAEQVGLSIQRIKANGGVYGNVPWGYEIKGEKYSKTAEPTELCRTVVPQIFERCISGDSLRTISAWLDSQHVPTPRGGNKWSESTVLKILKSRTYAGRLTTRTGVTVARCEAVITADVFDRASTALKTRPHVGPRTANRPLLVNLKCARCGSPMYRTRAGRNGTYCYYRCVGSGAQRKGCGNLVRYEDTEQIVHAIITLLSTDPYETREWVAGENWDSESSDVMQDIRELAMEPMAEGFLDKMAAKQAELAELKSRKAVPGHYELRQTIKPDGNVLTIGEYFHNLDYDGQRDYLKTHDIRIEKKPNGVRVVLDGEDHGVWALTHKA